MERLIPAAHPRRSPGTTEEVRSTLSRVEASINVTDSGEKKPIVGAVSPLKYGSSNKGRGNDSGRKGGLGSSGDGGGGGGDGGGDGGGGGGGGVVNPKRRLSIHSILNYLAFWKRFKSGSLHSPTRTIYLLQPDKNRESKFCSNKISTTKYNVLTFLPLFFWDQFTRYANLFFLFISIIQQIPGVSPTGHFTTIIPLSLVLLAVAIKEIVEDFRRFKADNQVNHSHVKVLCRDPSLGWSGATWQSKPWTKVKVGEIIQVDNKKFFPADLLLLSSSETHGICYVETSNLDGETNLKIRQAHSRTAHLNEWNIADCEGWEIRCEVPNNRLYQFSGNLYKVSPGSSEPSIHSLQPDQILLRGTQLRNTSNILGVVIYTGHDSKLMKNATRVPLKRSRMDHVTNYQIIGLFCFLLFLAVLSSLFSSIWNIINLNRLDHWYLSMTSTSGIELVNFFKSIITFIILYNNLIPISLIVTLEIMKFVQAYFINWDVQIYDAQTDTRALARNSNLNEDLGQVKYIFSDKTGTLTENIMIFKMCSVAGQVYSMDPPEQDTPECRNLMNAFEKSSEASVAVSDLENFLLALSLCHTIIPEQDEGKLSYRASSPDEEALVKAARDVGVVFKARTPSHVIIEVRGEERMYEILNLLEFNSDRKRMSVIVRTPTGQVKLLCKGADSVIYERLKGGKDMLSKITGRQLERFAVDGLRTLCIAEKVLGEEEYKTWSHRYHAASIILSNREHELDQAAEEIENELVLLGATAIEDKLQQGVPGALEILREAGIKVWVLTGDKQETAINIGFASRQLTVDMSLLIIDGSTETVVKRVLDDHLVMYKSNFEGVDTESRAALIIGGKALSLALTETNRQSFLDLALACKAVICCRVSPLQKAEVVKLVQKKYSKQVTLAIGDGANDVSMIQAAHVGVGISGREGLQATLASDYAIAQFRFLVRLLLVHGAWNYNRQAKVILFSFYKNIVLYTIEFWFAMFNGFSGQPLFERWTIGLYNVLFTASAPFTFGFFEQNLSAEGRLANPHLYRPLQAGKDFNPWVFWKWISLSLYHSIVLFFGVYLMTSQEVPFGNGKVMGLWCMGNTVYTCVVITVNLKLALESQYWPWIHHLTVWGSILLWFLFLLIYSHFWPTFPLAEVMVGIDYKLYSSIVFYCVFFLAPFIAMFPDLLKTVIQKIFYPTALDLERLRSMGRAGWSFGRSSYMKFDDKCLSVSYSARYAERLAAEGRSSLTFNRETRGFAFAQEDHDNKSKGTSVQRRSLIRMFDTSNKQ